MSDGRSSGRTPTASVVISLLRWTMISFLFVKAGSFPMAILMGVLGFFLAPVFYPIDVLPPAYRALIAWNPITIPIVQLRDLILWDKPLDWGLWSVSLAISAAVCYIGYWWFQKSRRGFADVL